MEYFYTSDKKLLAKMKEGLRRERDRYISVIALHEVYTLVLAKEGRKVAKSSLKFWKEISRW